MRKLFSYGMGLTDRFLDLHDCNFKMLKDVNKNQWNEKPLRFMVNEALTPKLFKTVQGQEECFQSYLLKNITFTIHATPPLATTTPCKTSGRGWVRCVCRYVSKFQNWPKEVKRRSRFVKNVRKNEISFYLSSNKNLVVFIKL